MPSTAIVRCLDKLMISGNVKYSISIIWLESQWKCRLQTVDVYHEIIIVAFAVSDDDDESSFVMHLPAVQISNVKSTFNNKNLFNRELYRKKKVKNVKWQVFFFFLKPSKMMSAFGLEVLPKQAEHCFHLAEL
ncbi:hypothetical protein T4B_13481 [Trichinella pseudospiralis]|uniref:Uncharacterized protein n=1 Tax=Trichinella pseudospiralis TaxID=6337 RepID=A0A0V1HNT5_TRIPS|nr:hypothetical protein T4B_13481 [Trichinella pseudospiralis]